MSGLTLISRVTLRKKILINQSEKESTLYNQIKRRIGGTKLAKKCWQKLAKKIYTCKFGEPRNLHLITATNRSIAIENQTIVNKTH